MFGKTGALPTSVCKQSACVLAGLAIAVSGFAAATPARAETSEVTISITSNVPAGARVVASQQVFYTVTAKNTGTATLTGLAISDDMTTVLSKAVMVTQPSAAGGIMTVTAGVGWTWFGNLAAGQTVTFTYSVRVGFGASASGQLVNRVTSNMPGNCQAGSGNPACVFVVNSVKAAAGVKTLPKLYLVAGKSATLPGVVQPIDAPNKAVTWSSSNPGVAKVDAQGKVTATAKAGKSATITVTSADGNFKASCKVYVVAKATSLQTLQSPPTNTTGLGVNQTLQIKPTWKPAKATSVVPTYTSSNPGVATIDKAGVITGMSAGKATITVKAGSKTKKFVVTVGTVAPTKITLNKKTASVARGKKVALQAAGWTPSSANPKTLIWKSSNKKIATVNANGVVTGKAKGKVTITATTWNGKTAKCTLTVK